jgi:hypothetical protein
MSLATLADDEILRTDHTTLNLAPVINPHLNQVVADLHLNAGDVPNVLAAVRSVAAESPIQETPGSSALDGLVKYIPTESITLYVAAAAAISTLTATFPWLTSYSLYGGFVVLTPIFFLLIYIGKRRSQNLPSLPRAIGQWPWWKLVASTIAFGVWALAVPPLITTDAGKIVAAFGAILVSTILSLIGAVAEPRPVADTQEPAVRRTESRAAAHDRTGRTGQAPLS